MKTCKKCKVEKPNSEFYKSKASKDGLQTRCKPCLNVLTEFVTVEVKRCSRCNTIKSAADFTIDRKSRDMLKYYCKDCNHKVGRKWVKDNPIRHREYINAWVKEYFKNNPEKAPKEWTRIKISDNTYAVMLQDFNGQCAMCHKSPNYPLIVDHSHSTGKVRGLLCKPCNMLLGHFGDDLAPVQEWFTMKPSEFGKKAVSYLSAAENKDYGFVPVEGESK